MSSYTYGWRIALFYFPILYAVLFLANLLGKSLANKVFGKDTCNDISPYLSNEYILRHYASGNGAPFSA